MKLLAYCSDYPCCILEPAPVATSSGTGANMGCSAARGIVGRSEDDGTCCSIPPPCRTWATYRLFRRDAIETIRPCLDDRRLATRSTVAHGSGGARRSLRGDPISYHQRVGESSVTGDLWKAFNWRADDRSGVEYRFGPASCCACTLGRRASRFGPFAGIPFLGTTSAF